MESHCSSLYYIKKWNLQQFHVFDLIVYRLLVLFSIVKMLKAFEANKKDRGEGEVSICYI